MLWETVDEVEVEITQEIWEVLFDHAHYSQSCMIECLDGRRNGLSWNHVVFEEYEGTHDQFLDLEPLLNKGVIWLANCIQALKTW